MASLIDLFNPTFLMFLGILVLIISGLVIYFESKHREQNHKIASMLSVVSSLAEEVHCINIKLLKGNSHLDKINIVHEEPNNLIVVSDNEDSDTDSESDTESDFSSNVKVLKISISDESSVNDGTIEDDESYDEYDEEDSMDINSIEEFSNTFVQETLSLKYENENATEINDDINDINDEINDSKINDDINDDINDNEINNKDSTFISSTDLKSIKINLEEPEEVDYTKLTLPKLRVFVNKKGLGIDTSKLKKNELLKIIENK
jgi:hypothetical protein